MASAAVARTKRIALNRIVVDAGTQVRAAIDDAVVAHYAERMAEGDLFPPVVLFHDGSRYYLADGFHRTLAAQRLGWREIDADVRAGTTQDALWCALAANKANGKPMTSADKKHAIVLALQAWPDYSPVRIAQQVGCTDQWVRDVRHQHQSALKLPDRTVGRDGKSRPATRPAAAPSRQPAEARRDQIAALAGDGYSTNQIADRLGVGRDRVTEVAQQFGIDVRADRSMGKTRRHDANRIVERMVFDAEHLTADVNLIAFDELEPASMGSWVERLKGAQRALAAFIRRLEKEEHRVA